MRTKINPRDGLTYVWIPPGTFRMGCSPHDTECTNEEKPAHSVRLTKGFWIGQTPVTQAAYKKVVGTNPSNFKGNQLPVESVSWDDAQAYCKAAKMRLPTEAEWEYAARGGGVAARYAPLNRIAWYIGNSGNRTHRVGQKEANGYELYDMLGNVLEWVADWYGDYGPASVVDPKGPSQGTDRVWRGGACASKASEVRLSFRGGLTPTDRYGYVSGFRCAGN